jgi:hypothetical protein
MVEDDNGDYVLYTPLIAAAPEMLEALEAIDDMLRNLSYADRVDMRTLARTAIAKAKGGTP